MTPTPETDAEEWGRSAIELLRNLRGFVRTKLTAEQREQFFAKLKELDWRGIPLREPGGIPHMLLSLQTAFKAAVPPKAKPGGTLSRVHRRLIEPVEDDEFSRSYQHTIFCQIGLPYRNPGDDIRV